MAARSGYSKNLARAWCLLGGLSPLAAMAQDVVTLRPSQAGEAIRQVQGEVLEYTGESLRIRRLGGREESFPAHRVASVSTTWSDPAQVGLKLLDSRRYDEARPLLLEATRLENRAWARRRLIADYARCLFHEGNWSDAAKALALVHRDDPNSIYLDRLPLVFSAGEIPLAAAGDAQAWLQGGDSDVLRLVAASWLLAGGQRAAATQALRDLGSADAAIASAAAVQLRREQVVSADAATVQRWIDGLKSLHPTSAGGSHFLIAAALARLGQRELAAMHWMRCAILHPGNERLTAESLTGAARQLQLLERDSEAVSLLQETLRDYPSTPAAAEARLYLQQLQPGS